MLNGKNFFLKQAITVTIIIIPESSAECVRVQVKGTVNSSRQKNTKKAMKPGVTIPASVAAVMLPMFSILESDTYQYNNPY